jgi:sarcosine oxidase
VKAAVVGAGVMGLAATRALAQRGHDVTLYEQFALKHTRGSSHGASRIFRLSYTEEHWIRLAQRAYELWRELEDESRTTLLSLEGLLDVEPDAAARIAAFEGSGVAYEELTAAEVRDRFNVVYPDNTRILHTRDAGITFAEAAVEAFAAGARSAGAEIREHARVESLADVPGDRVVVTAGAWSRQLLAGVGFELDATATRETVAYYAGRAIPSIIDKLQPNEFFALTAPGVGVKAGLHHSGLPTDPDAEGVADEDVVRAVSAWVAERLPGVDPEPLGTETCIYTNIDDDRFVCEGTGRYVVGSACSGHGFKFAPAVGELLADLAES